MRRHRTSASIKVLTLEASANWLTCQADGRTHLLDNNRKMRLCSCAVGERLGSVYPAGPLKIEGLRQSDYHEHAGGLELAQQVHQLQHSERIVSLSIVTALLVH